MIELAILCLVGIVVALVATTYVPEEDSDVSGQEPQ